MLPEPTDIVIVMTRLPCAGRNKTRLIPVLGPAGAAAMHDRLARHSIGRASSFVLMHPGTALRICLDGGSPADGRAWLGDCDCRIQAGGDLGQRLAAAVDDAFGAGARRVVVIGTDCPSLDEPLLAAAFAALDRSDLVFGPAADGGYYLIGLSRPCPPVFRGIDWGGPEVLRQSLEAARASDREAALLEVRADVDAPEDLPSAEVSLAAGSTLSVMVSAQGKVSHWPHLLERLLAESPCQIIIGSARILPQVPATSATEISVLRCGEDRLRQAAAEASGEFLLFLDAETLPPAGYADTIRRMLQQPGTSAGAFRFGNDGSFSVSQLVGPLSGLRCLLEGTSFVGRGLFIRRRIFRHIGRFRD